MEMNEKKIGRAARTHVRFHACLQLASKGQRLSEVEEQLAEDEEKVCLCVTLCDFVSLCVRECV
jgi:hypothetical protein